MTPQAKMFLAMLHEGADGHGPITRDGQPHGRWVFVSGGRTRAEGWLLDGAPHGLWRVWDASGRLRSESQWDRGAPRGRWVTWDANGHLERIDVKGEQPDDSGAFRVLSPRTVSENLPV
jgi:hypothetical protein